MLEADSRSLYKRIDALLRKIYKGSGFTFSNQKVCWEIYIKVVVALFIVVFLRYKHRYVKDILVEANLLASLGCALM